MKPAKKIKTSQVKAVKSERPPLRPYILKHREDQLLDLLNSYPNEVVRGLSKRPEAGWHFGRLYLVGAISWREYSAAVYLDRVTRVYEKMLQRYGHVHAVNLEKTDVTTTEDLSKSAQKKFARAKKKYDELYGVLDQCGKEVKVAIIDTLRKDAKADLRLLTRGLTVISAGLIGKQTRRIRSSQIEG